jgi:hypothetical protein
MWTLVLAPDTVAVTLGSAMPAIRAISDGILPMLEGSPKPGKKSERAIIIATFTSSGKI